MARKRIILKPSDEDQRKLEFITAALGNIDAREFLLSVIPVHYDEICRMISNGLPSHNAAAQPAEQEVTSDS